MAVLKLFLLGATGYIGGALLVALRRAYPDIQILALVRARTHAAAVRRAGADAVVLGSHAELDRIRALAASVDIVVNAADSDDMPLTQAVLAGLRARNGGGGGGGSSKLKRTRTRESPLPVLIHTSGTGVVSDTARGRFTDGARKIWNDNDEDDIRSIKETQPHRLIDLEIFRADERGDVSAYIIAPSAVYGVGEGPVKKISSQIPNMIRAAVKRRQTVYIGEGTNRWMNVHIRDLVALYLLVLELALSGADAHTAYGKFFFGSVGEHAWGAVAGALAPLLHQRAAPVVDSPRARSIPWDDALRLTANNSRSVSERGFALGWKPQAKSLEDTLEEDVDATLTLLDM